MMNLTQEKPTRRLFSFGCSYSGFKWPTWVNFIGSNFDEHITYAKSGSGNRYIFLAVTHALQTYKINDDDVFLIQWSSLNREDRIIKNNTQFSTPGNLLFQNEYPDNFIDDLFTSTQQGFELISYIFTLKNLLKLNNIKFLMTNMLEPYFDTFLGEPSDNVMYKKYNTEINNLNLLEKLEEMNKTDFLTSIESFRIENNIKNNIKMFICYKGHEQEIINSDIDTDTHPAPNEHLSYAKYVYKEFPHFFKENNLFDIEIEDIVNDFEYVHSNRKIYLSFLQTNEINDLIFPEKKYNKIFMNKEFDFKY